ncbi:uncharacterized protein si:dkey-211g8.8 [Puntigrus tetrazona]|uniref:uncharacterized protein si:dkey-211g8.8 n=1 Tax=Puntigrus tetrazona TaxID=1606681 RepID=UPI001C899CAA|nr:uncharacterized protein si:dkey-211g8.8 [Puntigrus tetrazona]
MQRRRHVKKHDRPNIHTAFHVPRIKQKTQKTEDRFKASTVLMSDYQQKNICKHYYKYFHSIIKDAKTSSEYAVPEENSSAKSLKVCDRSPRCDSAEVCFHEINQNAGPSAVKNDTTQQNIRDIDEIALHSGKEQPSLKSPKRPLFNGPPEDGTFIVGNGKKKRKSDNSQPVDNKRPEINQDLEDKENNTSNREGNENKPHINLSFESEQMKEKRFLYEIPETFAQNSEDGNSTAKMPDQPFGVRTSWEEFAIQKIENLADGSIEDLNSNNSVPITIRISDFFHYAKIIAFLFAWYEQEKQDRRDIIFIVGRFSVRLQASNLYCCPVKKDEQEIQVNDKKLSYATLKLSQKIAKNYSETIWNYMTGNHDKVESYVLTPQDAIAVCAVLFSEVIRYPRMFFHNILLMEYYKSWSEFCDYHPMVTGGSWKHQSKDKVPGKVLQKEQENLLFCAKKIMSDEGKRSNLFKVTSSV